MRFWSAGLVLALAVAGSGARAATVVTVQLGDAADEKSMAMKLDKTAVKAGAVDFEVTNLSKGKVHEMIVVALKSKGEKLAYDSKSDTVDELKITDLGEAADLDPGAKKV